MSGRLEQLKFSEICKNLSRGKSIYTKHIAEITMEHIQSILQLTMLPLAI